MFEYRKIRLLNDKLFLLGEKKSELVKEGKYKEAEKVDKEMNELTIKIQQLTEKHLEKSWKKIEKTNAKIDKKLNGSNMFPDLGDEKAEEYLAGVMKR